MSRIARRFVALDFEMTGFDPVKDEIIEVGAVAFDRAGGISERFDSLVRPKGEVTFGALAITGIDPAELEEAPDIDGIRERLTSFLEGASLVGQSIEFEVTALRQVGIESPSVLLDTWHLASIFLPGLDAYRLEVIARSLGIRLAEAHRALPDAEATARVFLSLLERIEGSLSLKQGKDLGAILDRSEYGLKEIWGELEFRGEGRIEVLRPESAEGGRGDSELGSLIGKVRKESAPRRGVVAEPHCNIAEALIQSLAGGRVSGRSLVVLPRMELVWEASRRLGARMIFGPSEYLSEKRVQDFLKAPTFRNDEVIFALRLRLFLDWTERGSRDELPLFGADYRLWELVSCRGLGRAEATDERFLKEQQGELWVTHHRSLPEVALGRVEEIMIADYQVLDEAISAAQGRRLDQRDGERLPSELQPEFDLCMGLLGIVLETSVEPGLAQATLRIRPTIRRSKQWGQFEQAARHFNERDPESGSWIERAELTRVQEILETIINFLEEEVVWINLWQGVLSLHLFPRSVASTIEVVAGGRRTLLVSKAEEGFPVDTQVWRQERSRVRPKIVVVRGVSQGAGLAGAIRVLISQFGRVGIYCPSGSLVRELAPLLSDGFEREVVAEGVTGTRGRVEELLRADPSRVLLVGPRWWERGLNGWFEAILVPRLAFDLPHDPVHEARSEMRGGFAGYSLPRAVGKLRGLIEQLQPEGELYILDSRLQSRDYGARVLSDLGLEVRYRDLES